MKKTLTIFFCFSLLLLTTAPALADSPFYEGDDYDLDDEFIYDNMFFSLENEEQLAAKRVLNEIIIKFRDASEVPGNEKQLQKEIDKVKKVGFVEALGVYVVNVDDLEKNPNAVLNRFKNNRFIEYVEPNHVLDFSFTPNDPGISNMSSGLTITNTQAGWDIAKGENSPIIAIVDSGVASHPDLPTPVKGYSAVASLAYSNDAKVGHGTQVAGTAGAIGNNGIGTTGINMKANIMAVKIDDAAGSVPAANIAKGLTWAADNGAKVVNMSIGLLADNATIKSAVDYTYKKGIAMFAAAGNSGVSPVEYPARYNGVMAVGATSAGTTRALWSNYGTELDVVASGSHYTTTAAGGYTLPSGTSFSSPKVAALASLIYSLLPNASNEDVYSIIRQGAKPLGGGYNIETGYGVVDIGKTLSLASSMAAPAPKPVYTTPPIITLTGFSEISLFVGDTYQETGYKAVDCLGVDITKDVKITGTVNTAKAGINTLAYEVSDAGGNSARATRTVNVEAKQVVIVPPKITVNGSNPIILHLDSSTPYLEQGAKAIDSDGKDISASVSISGSPDRYKAGTYTVTYTATGKDGGVATATRSVHIIAATSEVAVRSSYNLNEQAKQGAKITHTGMVAGGSGFVDLKLVSIDKNMTISVQFVNTATRAVTFRDTFSAAGSTQYKVNQGNYDMIVTIDTANGNSKYSFNLLTPEVITYQFDQKEVSY